MASRGEGGVGGTTSARFCDRPARGRPSFGPSSTGGRSGSRGGRGGGWWTCGDGRCSPSPPLGRGWGEGRGRWTRGWPGVRPGGRPTFFCSAKESRQRKAAPLAVSLRLAAGSLRCSCAGRRCRPHFALTALRSNSGGESEHDAGMLRCPPAPRPALLGTARRGLKSTHGPSLRSAARSAPPLRAAQQARSKGRGAGHSGTPWSGSPRPPALSPRGKARQRLRGEIILYGCCV